MKKLDAKNYLQSIGDRTHLKKIAVLSAHQWLIRDLTRKKPKVWRSNGALVYRDKKYDFLVCLPGAPMAMIIVEEMIATGVKEIIYLGTGAGLRKQPSGTFLENPRVISVLNPYSEQKDVDWLKIEKENIEIIDMEAEYLIRLAKERKINLYVGLIVTDHVSKNKWEPLVKDNKYKDRYRTSINSIKTKFKI